jgi:hypothetical protein
LKIIFKELSKAFERPLKKPFKSLLKAFKKPLKKAVEEPQ